MTLLEVDDTIVAIASPTSPAPRGVVRMSGDETLAILQQMGIHCEQTSRARRLATHIDVGTPLGTIPVEVMVWPTHRSYTGQPSAELHTYGSLPLLRALVDKAGRCGARAARPGEYTMRAFLAGRLDLTQAEAVLGVIEAEQRGTLDHALRQLSGNLSQPLERMRSTLLDLLADVEAGLDFVDEDISFISDQDLIDRLSAIAIELEQTLRLMQNRGGGSARITVALCGPPNAGKSCLINRLADQQVAIVAPVAGTTRDTVTVDIELQGNHLTLIDTAGIEEAETEVSLQSQAQAQRSTSESRVRLWCVDSTSDDFAAKANELQELANRTRRPQTIDLWIATKTDAAIQSTSTASTEASWIPCSALNGDGIERLKISICETLKQHDTEEIGSVVGTAARCSQSLHQAIAAIQQAIHLTGHQEGHEFVSAELRTVAQCLGEVTGTVYTDDILDRVFGRFCIGK
ncbi:MAG: tRNA uridine-5-carboxymethylaminomethyl(34) synthesis GTPase MnmE [Rhodopirellula sp.]|nr:tRNA uridine-5-carboxymethylaminomethyl(34) synthesis GTPase MnmE [Rhodopirellula sp.]